MTRPPTLIFVPGSWHKPTCYRKTIQLLEEHYLLRCVTTTLPSTIDNPAATFKDDVDTVREAISSEVNQGNDVVIIAHSYGGMVGNSAIKDFTLSRHVDSRDPSAPAVATALHDTEPSQRPQVGYVIGLVLIASGFTLTGLSFMDPFFGRPPPSWRVNEVTGYAELVTPARELFYHDLPEDEAEYWTSQLTTQSLKALFEGGEHAYAGWKDVPVWYIGTVEDRGLPVIVQRMQVGMAREMGGKVEHRELPTSHSPFLSRPEQTAQIIAQSVTAFTNNGPANVGTSPESEIEGVITIPQINLRQPLSWYKFGLPIFCGRVLGRCILIFSWMRRSWSLGLKGWAASKPRA